jgi:hypothetical protein
LAKVYVVSFRTHNDRRPSKFIVLADNMKSAINKAWEHGGADFQSRFDKSTAQAEQMKEGVLRSSVMDNPLTVAEILLCDSRRSGSPWCSLALLRVTFSCLLVSQRS